MVGETKIVVIAWMLKKLTMKAIVSIIENNGIREYCESGARSVYQEQHFAGVQYMRVFRTHGSQIYESAEM